MGSLDRSLLQALNALTASRRMTNGQAVASSSFMQLSTGEARAQQKVQLQHNTGTPHDSAHRICLSDWSTKFPHLLVSQPHSWKCG
jgi:hypothetical protein